MNISEWREMAHWVEVYEWDLRNEEQAGLEWICIQMADSRFRNGTDVAEVSSAGHKSVLLSGPSVRRAYDVLNTKRGAAKKLLAAMAAKQADWPSIKERDEPRIERFAKTLNACKVEDKSMMKYAIDLSFFMIAVLELEHGFDKHGRLYCDPAMVRFAESLAKMRYADKLKSKKAKSKSKSKSKSSKKEAA